MQINLDIQQLKNGDPSEFNLLVSSLSPKVLNLSYHLIGNRSDAEDLTQEVFMAVHEGIHKFKEESLISTWVHRITLNKCNEHIRKINRKKRKGTMIPIDFVSSEIKYESQTDGPLLQKEKEFVLLMALQKLPENQRMAFQLYNNEEFSYIEIAEKMQISISAIESLLFRARKNLKNYLVPYKNCAL